MNRIEILAPAGSMEGLKAAINVGCDALYIGGMKFGARAYANNLDEDMLLHAIDYTHIHGKQLYLTVNTLLKNEELKEELYNYLRRFYLQGLDAVIVQDVGVMHFIHEHFPKLPIHASTQMTLTMADGVNELKKYGVTRIVPARELSLKEIARIRKSTDLEIEAFVHGALCYSYSGQCFMSSMIGGRSGNRGRCAQPCRMEYQVEEAQKVVSERDNSYVLSPKDMCTLPMVAEMIEAGIDSFKIEGRMKRPEYAAGVVAAYKMQADLYYELGPKGYAQYKKEHPEVMEKEMKKLQDLYNRGGFSTGYYDMHNGKEMMSMHRPNHSGVLVGHVVNRKGIQAEIALCEDVNAQDILEFRHNGEATYEFTVKDNTRKGSVLRTNTKPNSKIERADEVYRTRNSALLEDIAERYMNVDEKIKIYGELSAEVGKPLQLTLWTTLPMVIPGTNIKKEPMTIDITEFGDEVSEALKQPMNAANVEEKLKKTNDTPFEFEQITANLIGNVFFPIGKLNELRRNALAHL
ncbi:MAG: U32 family peptidase, partial [Clostridiales bacterium]|nr:U32 family peptidase [Clostridiales bacterium]